MISYKPFFKTLKRKNITQYQLIKDYNIRTSLLDKLRNDKNIYVSTLNDICNILECGLEDVIEYTPDKKIDMDNWFLINL